jgi:hypothetical protein
MLRPEKPLRTPAHSHSLAVRQAQGFYQHAKCPQDEERGEGMRQVVLDLEWRSFLAFGRAGKA